MVLLMQPEFTMIKPLIPFSVPKRPSRTTPGLHVSPNFAFFTVVVFGPSAMPSSVSLPSLIMEFCTARKSQYEVGWRTNQNKYCPSGGSGKRISLLLGIFVTSLIQGLFSITHSTSRGSERP